MGEKRRERLRWEPLCVDGGPDDRTWGCIPDQPDHAGKRAADEWFKSDDGPRGVGTYRLIRVVEYARVEVERVYVPQLDVARGKVTYSPVATMAVPAMLTFSASAEPAEDPS